MGHCQLVGMLILGAIQYHIIQTFWATVISSNYVGNPFFNVQNVTYWLNRTSLKTFKESNQLKSLPCSTELKIQVQYLTRYDSIYYYNVMAWYKIVWLKCEGRWWVGKLRPYDFPKVYINVQCSPSWQNSVALFCVSQDSTE